MQPLPAPWLGQPQPPQPQSAPGPGLGALAATLALAAVIVLYAAADREPQPAEPERRRRSAREPVVVGRADPSTAREIERLIDKYMEMLRISGPRPIVRLRDNLGRRWLGRAWRKIGAPGTTAAATTTIELQRAIIGHQRTLERVVAHEMIHHRDFLSMDDLDKARLRLGIRQEGHGEQFLQGAAMVNAQMGPGFVTIKSDQEDVLATNTRLFFVLIQPAMRDRLGWTWAARLSPTASQWAARKIAQGARLVSTTDERWAAGPRIGHGRVAIPEDAENVERLKALYDTGTPVALPTASLPAAQAAM